MNFAWPYDAELVLASASPRRAEILSCVGIPFTVVTSDCDENTVLGPLERAEFNARLKADDIRANHPKLAEKLVLTSDTIVSFGDVVFGKPADEEDAFRMLKLLSGKTHVVSTGCTLSYRGQQHGFTERTEVTFRELSDQEIRDYIATGEPLDKAGAYGIQGLARVFISGINGCYYNVVGLPLTRVLTETASFLQKFN